MFMSSRKPRTEGHHGELGNYWLISHPAVQVLKPRWILSPHCQIFLKNFTRCLDVELLHSQEPQQKIGVETGSSDVRLRLDPLPHISQSLLPQLVCFIQFFLSNLLCGFGEITSVGILMEQHCGVCDASWKNIKLFLMIINLVPVRKSTNWSRLTTTALLVKRQQPWFSLYWTPPQLSMFNWDKGLVLCCTVVALSSQIFRNCLSDAGVTFLFHLCKNTLSTLSNYVSSSSHTCFSLNSRDIIWKEPS